MSREICVPKFEDGNLYYTLMEIVASSDFDYGWVVKEPPSADFPTSTGPNVPNLTETHSNLAQIPKEPVVSTQKGDWNHIQRITSSDLSLSVTFSGISFVRHDYCFGLVVKIVYLMISLHIMAVYSGGQWRKSWKSWKSWEWNYEFSCRKSGATSHMRLNFCWSFTLAQSRMERALSFP